MQGQKFLLKHLALSHKISWKFLTSHQNLENTNHLVLRKCQERWTKGWSRSYYIGLFFIQSMAHKGYLQQPTTQATFSKRTCFVITLHEHVRSNLLIIFLPWHVVIFLPWHNNVLITLFFPFLSIFSFVFIFSEQIYTKYNHL